MNYGYQKPTLETRCKETEKLAEELINMLDLVPEEIQEYRDRLDKQKKLNSEEMIRRQTGEEAGQYMERFINCMSMKKDEDAFVDHVVNGMHRTLNQSLIGLIIKVMLAEAKLAETQRYDGRNEAAVMLCKNLKQELEESYLPFI